MNEKTIIEGKPSKKTSSILLKIGVALVVIGLILFLATVKSSWRADGEWPSGYLLDCLGDCISFTNGPVYFVSVVLDIGLILLIYSLLLWIAIKNNCITVTDKRVYGVTKWSKRVDLPLSQISAVSTSWLKGIAVGTSSGRIVFKAIENNIEVHKEITNLLATKQDVSTVQTVKVEKSNNIDDLKKLKELLDSGVITQEEFETKKKQLLGL